MITTLFTQLGVFILFIFVCRYLYKPEVEKGFWLKSCLIYISCFLYLKLKIVFLPLGTLILIYLLIKKEDILNRKLKLTIVTFGLFSFICVTVLLNYTNYEMSITNSKQSRLTEVEEKEINNTAFQYYEYLKNNDFYKALSLFPSDKSNTDNSLINKFIGSRDMTKTGSEFESNISQGSKINIMQRLVSNKEYQILYIPSKEDLKQVMSYSTDVYYYYCNLRIKYIDDELIIAECIYLKKINGIWKIINIQSTDRFLPYRAGIYNCESN